MTSFFYAWRGVAREEAKQNVPRGEWNFKCWLRKGRYAYVVPMPCLRFGGWSVFSVLFSLPTLRLLNVLNPTSVHTVQAHVCHWGIENHWAQLSIACMTGHMLRYFNLERIQEWIGFVMPQAGVCQVCLAHTPGDYKSVQRWTRGALFIVRVRGVPKEIGTYCTAVICCVSFTAVSRHVLAAATGSVWACHQVVRGRCFYAWKSRWLNFTQMMYEDRLFQRACIVNGYFRNLNWRYLLYIRLI